MPGLGLSAALSSKGPARPQRRPPGLGLSDALHQIVPPAAAADAEAKTTSRSTSTPAPGFEQAPAPSPAPAPNVPTLKDWRTRRPDYKKHPAHKAAEQLGTLSGVRRRGPLAWYQEAKEEETRGLMSEFSDAFKHSLVSGNFDMSGSALEAIGVLTGGDAVQGYGKNLQRWARGLDTSANPPSVGSWSEVDGIDDAMRFLAGGLGSGLGSTVPSMAIGGVGALAGFFTAGPPGAVVGGLAGAAAPSAVLNLGEAYDQFKVEGVDTETAAQVAMAITVPITALDTAGLFKAVGVVGRGVKRALYQRIAQGVKQGFLAEGGTEGLQSLIRESTAAVLTGNPDLQRRAMGILDEATIGALTGGAIGGVSGLRAPPVAIDEELDAGAGPDDGAIPGEGGPYAAELGVDESIEGELLPREGSVEPYQSSPELEVDPIESAIAENAVVRTDGTPYPTKRAAMLAKRGRQLEGRDAIKVPDGWILAPVQHQGAIPSPAQTEGGLKRIEERTAQSEEADLRRYEELTRQPYPRPTGETGEAVTYPEGTGPTTDEFAVIARSPAGDQLTGALAGGSPTLPGSDLAGGLTGGSPTLPGEELSGGLAGGSPTVPGDQLASGLAGTSPTPAGEDVQAALAGLPGTPEGDMVLEALSGGSPTPEGDVVAAALAGRGPMPDGNTLLGALAGISGTPQGNQLLDGLAGGSPTPQGTALQAVLAGGSPTLPGDQLAGGLAGGSPTVPGEELAGGLAGESPTIPGDQLTGALAGGTPTVPGEELAGGLAGGAPTVQGDQLAGGLAGRLANAGSDTGRTGWRIPDAHRRGHAGRTGGRLANRARREARGRTFWGGARRAKGRDAIRDRESRAHGDDGAQADRSRRARDGGWMGNCAEG